MPSAIRTSTILALSALATGIASAQNVEEVIVTAQKRAQSIQDVPISISAVSFQGLEANIVDDVYDLRAVVPALQIQAVDPPGQGTAFAIRGLGTSVFNMGFEPAVGTFIDGVYRSRSGLVASMDFVDLERVEVLKGPQGTLFGRNTSAGVVHFVSRRPSFEKMEGMVSASWEEHDRWRLKGTVNLPASETFAARISGTFADGDGWMDNVGQGARELQDLDRWNIKGQFLWQPREDLSVWASADYNELDEKCCYPLKNRNDPLVPIFNRPAAQAIGSDVIDPPDLDALNTEGNVTPVYEAEDKGFAVEINWEFGGVTFTSLTGYRDYDDSNFKDNDFTGVDVLRSNQNLPEVSLISEEFRIAGRFDGFAGGQSIDWIIGMFYSQEDIAVVTEFIWGPQINLFPFFAPGLFGIAPGRAFLADFEQEIESIAGFGHFTWQLNDQISVTGGIRWTRDEKDGTLVNDHPATNLFGLPSNSLPLPVVFDYDADVSFSEPTGTASLQYRWSDDLMTFFTYSRGYKSGGISMTRDAAGPAIFFGAPGLGCPPGSVALGGPLCGGSPGDPTFDPEFADHYELGAKFTFWNRLQGSLSLFRTEFTDLQLQTLRPDGTFAVTNVAGATAQGVEVEGFFAVNDYLDINASVQWLDATFDDGIGQITVGPGFIPFDNQNLPFSSEWTGTVGGNFVYPLGGTGWSFFLSGNAFFRTDYSNFTEPVTDRKQDGYVLTNFRGGVRSQDERWELAAWCRNCTDEIYTWSNFQIPFDGLILGHGSRWSHIAEPRFFGVTATYRF